MQRRGPSPSQSPYKRAGSLLLGGGAGDFSEDLTDGRGIAVEVVAAR